uniref:Conserved hypothetical plastid protein n=1 Tax=Boldia erythrosiphon TaxID=74908 RepID=A0A1X9PTK7_9RHOD|nr:conserved hypothetical plastid protein [Boldia erythrosiphon]ARO90649.1 conserved hypothetical plastid protein [Boldia erythrosiphon]
MSNKQIINITESAIAQIYTLSNSNQDIHIRIGIKQGGCSGMTYFMNLVKKEDIHITDEVLQYNSCKLICDSKSLLYLYGMFLDYKSSLIGGGFKFINPNATKICGCGKSFNI